MGTSALPSEGVEVLASPHTVCAQRRSPQLFPAACVTCEIPLPDTTDPLLLSLGTCAKCEMVRVRRRASEREKASLLAVLDDDTLVHLLSLACTGRFAHRTALALSASTTHLRELVATQLWRLLCTADEYRPLVERCVLSQNQLYPSEPKWCPNWRHIHRTLSVPIRFRSRSWKSWRLDHRLRRQHQEKPATLHLDAAAPNRLDPGHGFATWTPANHLLAPHGRSALLGDTIAVADRDVLAAGPRAGDFAGWAQGSEKTPLLFCVAREVSAQHLLLAGVLPSLSPAAKRALAKLPVGASPTLSTLDGAGSDKPRPPPRCLCCAMELRHVARHCGAVCAPSRELPPDAAKPPVMREASDWFRYDFAAWLPNGGCDQEAIKAARMKAASDAAEAAAAAMADGLSAVVGGPGGDGGAAVAVEALAAAAAGTGAEGRLPADAMYACLDTALVCPNGHVVLAYELYEREDGSTTDEEEEEEEDDDDFPDSEEEEEEEWVSTDEDDEDEEEDEDEEDDSEDDDSEDEDSEEDEDDEDDGDGDSDEDDSDEDSDESSDETDWRPRHRRSHLGSRPGSRSSVEVHPTPPPAAFAY